MKPTNFIPDLLPIDSDFYVTGPIMSLSHKATTQMTLLNDTLKNSKFKLQLLLTPLITEEAASSTRIEGTQVVAQDVFEVEASGKKNNKNIQEAINYIKAIRHGEGSIKDTGQITSFMLREMHKILMSEEVRGSNKKPGEFKTSENFIGKENSKREQADFIPPGPEHTVAFIDNLIEYINSETNDDFILIKLAVIHAQFETIHPFMDGNGRIGRVLIPLFLFLKKETIGPIFFLSRYLEKNQFQYYQNLNETRWPKNWGKWISFFLEKIIEQSQNTIMIINDVEKLYGLDLDILHKYHKHHQCSIFLDAIYANPIFKIGKISELTGIKYATCREYTKTLLENDSIYKNNVVRNATYYNYKLLDTISAAK
ncbi:Fic family protein [Proteiniclasticum sp. QWL-01]|uniref:Fic family protein n=1 Tax=Proteiniclasticum sp. QWL-01 TaxID=3036945 RepID=UPI00241085CE|nr:Fic family protein [Proteiniclasticum sp. QWL-01]WFF72995.1 Fic family protein [Proteiniclasticum sp. QWL-01]